MQKSFNSLPSLGLKRPICRDFKLRITLTVLLQKCKGMVGSGAYLEELTDGIFCLFLIRSPPKAYSKVLLVSQYS